MESHPQNPEFRNNPFTHVYIYIYIYIYKHKVILQLSQDSMCEILMIYKDRSALEWG